MWERVGMGPGAQGAQGAQGRGASPPRTTRKLGGSAPRPPGLSHMAHGVPMGQWAMGPLGPPWARGLIICPWVLAHHGAQGERIMMCPTGRGRGPYAHASEEALRHSGSAGCSSILVWGAVFLSLQPPALAGGGSCFLKGGTVVYVACRWAGWWVGVYELPSAWRGPLTARGGALPLPPFLGGSCACMDLVPGPGAL